MDGKNIFMNVRLVTDDILGTAAANRKLSKKVRGLSGWVFGLVVTCVVLITELAERKRCEKYLEEQIDDLKEKIDGKSEEDYAVDIQGQVDELEDRVNDLTWTVKQLDKTVPDGGVCDA